MAGGNSRHRAVPGRRRNIRSNQAATSREFRRAILPGQSSAKQITPILAARLISNSNTRYCCDISERSQGIFSNKIILFLKDPQEGVFQFWQLSCFGVKYISLMGAMV